MTEGASGLTWSRWTEAPAIVVHRDHLGRTISVALVVGTILFLINQLDVVMAGDATTRTWIKAATTYVVPFLVANYGVLTATRRRDTRGDVEREYGSRPEVRRGQRPRRGAHRR
jgi:hypothetical protein